MQVATDDGSLPFDNYPEVYDLVQKGNVAFRAERFQEVSESGVQLLDVL